MKNYLPFIATFLLSVQIICAQQTQPLPAHPANESTLQIPDYFANNPEWRENWTFAYYYPCIDYHKYVYYVKGDTTIGNYVYKDIYKRGQVTYSWNGPPPANDCEGTDTYNYHRAYLRQSGRRIFIHESGQDFLLFMFELEEGDQLPDTYYTTGEDIYVSGVDSILVGENYRKIFSLTSGFFGSGDLLIEGIGYAYGGFLGIYPDWEFPATVDCFALNGVTYYPEYGAYCDLTVDVTEIDPGFQNLQILSNRSLKSVTLNISGTDQGIAKIDIIDIAGRKMLHDEWKLLSGNNTRVIHLSQLEEGVYILIVSSDSQISFREKIVLDW